MKKQDLKRKAAFGILDFLTLGGLEARRNGMAPIREPCQKCGNEFEAFVYTTLVCEDCEY